MTCAIASKLSKNVGLSKSISTAFRRRTIRKDSAVHVSLSFLKPDKQRHLLPRPRPGWDTQPILQRRCLRRRVSSTERGVLIASGSSTCQRPFSKFLTFSDKSMTAAILPGFCPVFRPLRAAP